MFPNLEFIKTVLNAIRARFQRIKSDVASVRSDVDAVRSDVETTYLPLDAITNSMSGSTDHVPSDAAVQQYAEKTYEKLFKTVVLTPSDGAVTVATETHKFFDCGEVTSVVVKNPVSNGLDCYIRFDCGDTPASVDFSNNVEIIKRFATISSNRSYLLHLIGTTCYITEMQSAYPTTDINKKLSTVSNYTYTDATANPYNEVINSINAATADGANLVVDWDVMQNLLAEKDELLSQLVKRTAFPTDIVLPEVTVEFEAAEVGKSYTCIKTSQANDAWLSKSTRAAVQGDVIFIVSYEIPISQEESIGYYQNYWGIMMRKARDDSSPLAPTNTATFKLYSESFPDGEPPVRQFTFLYDGFDDYRYFYIAPYVWIRKSASSSSYVGGTTKHIITVDDVPVIDIGE